jgi:hypothetical protein
MPHKQLHCPAQANHSVQAFDSRKRRQPAALRSASRPAVTNGIHTVQASRHYVASSLSPELFEARNSIHWAGQR